MKCRSTTTNLMSFVSSLKNKMDKNQQVDTIYIDFAFDKVTAQFAGRQSAENGSSRLDNCLVAFLLDDALRLCESS